MRGSDLRRRVTGFLAFHLGRRRFPVRTLLSDREVLITWLPGQSRTLVLVFAGQGAARRGRDRLEFPDVASAQGRNHVLFISDLARSWYSRPGLCERIAGVVRGFMATHGIVDVAALGNSMGGFGAILFCKYLPIANVAAFVPQISMVNEVIDGPLWASSRARITDAVEKDLGPILSGSRCRFSLVYGDHDEDDNIHRARVPLAGNVEVLVIRGCDHKVARWIKDRGMLPQIARAMLTGDRAAFDTCRLALNSAA